MQAFLLFISNCNQEVFTPVPLITLVVSLFFSVCDPSIKICKKILQSSFFAPKLLAALDTFLNQISDTGSPQIPALYFLSPQGFEKIQRWYLGFTPPLLWFTIVSRTSRSSIKKLTPRFFCAFSHSLRSQKKIQETTYSTSFESK